MTFFKGVGVAVCLLALSSTALASGPAWDFMYSGSSFSQMNQPAPLVDIGLVIKGASSGSGSFFTPTGQSQGQVEIGDRGSGANEAFSDFNQFQTFNATSAGGTWTLNALNTIGAAQYYFSADFSNVSIPQVIITAPLQGVTTDARPTFQWSATGPGSTIVQVSNADFSVDISQLLVPGQTTFTVPSDLPAGDYSFFVEMSLPTTNIPVTLMRETGPDLGITPNGTFSFLSEAFDAFTVVPEPMGMGLIGMLAMMGLRTRA